MTFALAAAAGAQAAGPGSATAESPGGELRYNCVLSPFPGQPMTARLVLHAPGSVAVGQTTPVSPVDATATVGPTVAWALGVVGAATVEGNVDAPGVVRAPEGNKDAALRLNVPRINVPASGPMTVRATGTTPQFVFRQPGPASVTAGNTMTLRFVLKDAGGNPTSPSQVDLSCTLDPGQDTVVFSFEITPAAAAPPAPPAAAPPAPGPPARTAPTGGAGPTRPGTAGTATPGAAGSPAAPIETTTSNGAAGPSTTSSATPAPETPANTSAEVNNAAATVVTSLAAKWRWWLIGAGILAVVAVIAALGGPRWLRRRKT